MATTFDNKPGVTSLEDEVQTLVAEENRLDDRASSLELKTILVAMLAGAALIFGVAALAVALIRTGGSNSGTRNAAVAAGSAATAGGGVAASASPNAALPVKSIKMAVKGDAKPAPGGDRHDAFFPGALTVKAGQRVRMTVYNYDDMPHSFTSPGLAKGAAIPAALQQMQGTAQDLKTMPGPGIGIDKMIPPGTDKRPSKTVITFTAPSKAGHYIWYCKVPCDPWAMAHFGYMRGRMNVTSA